jgi:hypothetical protein
MMSCDVSVCLRDLNLQVLHDASVFETLRLRYFNDRIYTQGLISSVVGLLCPFIRSLLTLAHQLQRDPRHSFPSTRTSKSCRSTPRHNFFKLRKVPFTVKADGNDTRALTFRTLQRAINTYKDNTDGAPPHGIHSEKSSAHSNFRW